MMTAEIVAMAVMEALDRVRTMTAMMVMMVMTIHVPEISLRIELSLQQYCYYYWCCLTRWSLMGVDRFLVDLRQTCSII